MSNFHWNLWVYLNLYIIHRLHVCAWSCHSTYMRPTCSLIHSQGWCFSMCMHIFMYILQQWLNACSMSQIWYDNELYEIVRHLAHVISHMWRIWNFFFTNAHVKIRTTLPHIFLRVTHTGCAMETRFEHEEKLYFGFIFLVWAEFKDVRFVKYIWNNSRYVINQIIIVLVAVYNV